jgi:hypothetical protein
MRYYVGHRFAGRGFPAISKCFQSSSQTRAAVKEAFSEPCHITKQYCAPSFTMSNDPNLSTRTSGGGFLRPSDAVAVKTKIKGIGIGPSPSQSIPTSQKSTLSTPFDDLRWPYAISPLRAYLCGVITVWAIIIIYHFIMVAIHAVRKRKRILRREKGKRKSQPKSGDDHRPHSLHTAHSARPSARMAEIPPVSPVYQPCKMSMVKVHRKLAKKIRARSAFRQRFKSRREFRSQTRAKKAAILPTSPSCELFQHMTFQPLSKSDSRHSFVHLARMIANNQSSNEILPEAKDTAEEETHKKPGKEEVNNIENTASSDKKASIAETRYLTVLFSSGVYEYTQKAQQKEALDLLNDLQISHVKIDGMDPLQRDTRNHLFEVSGVRGHYPQIFCSTDGDAHTYLGGYDWLQCMAFEDLRKIVAGT